MSDKAEKALERIADSLETIAKIWTRWLLGAGTTYMDPVDDDELAAAHKAVALLNSMVLSGEDHSDQSRKVVADVLLGPKKEG